MLKGILSFFYPNAESKQAKLNNDLIESVTKYENRFYNNYIDSFSTIHISSLIKAGADVNQKDIHGFTPLHRATFNDCPDVVTLLLQNNADVNAKDNDGRIALHFAWSKQVAELLLENTSDINAKDNFGRTPLHLTKSKAAAELLLEKSSDINATDIFGEIPLDTFLRKIPASASITFSRFLPMFIHLAVAISEHNEQIATLEILIKATLLENPDKDKPTVLNNYEESSNFWDICKEEVKKMRAHKILQSLYSFHDICVAKNLKLTRICRHSTVKTLAYHFLEQEFPCFCTQLWTNIQKGIFRNNALTESVNYVFNNSSKEQMFLGMNELNMVFDYLPTKDLVKIKNMNSKHKKRTIGTIAY
ncbi:MAG: ankyrin repeat domain-containing protein [Pseudomonadota bacterium]